MSLLLKSPIRFVPRRQPQCRHIGNATFSWFRRFLTPKEEAALYVDVTSSFRKQLLEGSQKTKQSYSNIIEDVILHAQRPPTVLPMEKLKELKQALDDAGKEKNVAQLHKLATTMTDANISSVALFNRLIRAYITADALPSAQNVLNILEKQRIMPSTRTFTYLINAHVYRGQMDKARQLVQQMQHLSLTRFRSAYDCSVMMKYYIQADEPHALECLWRDMMKHVDSIAPGPSLSARYMGYLTKHANHAMLSEVAQDMVSRLPPELTPAQAKTVFRAVPLLAPEQPKLAESLTLFAVRACPTTSVSREAVQHLIMAYVAHNQDLRALTVYHRLRKEQMPDHVFSEEVKAEIERIATRIETEREMDTADNKAMLAELGILDSSSSSPP